MLESKRANWLSGRDGHHNLSATLLRQLGIGSTLNLSLLNAPKKKSKPISHPIMPHTDSNTIVLCCHRCTIVIINYNIGIESSSIN